MIDWQRPFATAPRDGRPILAWYEDEEVDCLYYDNQSRPNVWRDSRSEAVIHASELLRYTHWAEINPPEPEEQSPTVTLTEYKVPGFPEPVEPEYYTKVKKLVADEQDARIRSEFMKSELIKE